MEARLTAVVDTRGAAKADRELNAIAKTSKVVDINVRKTERSFKSFGSSAASAVAAVDGPLGGISSRITALTSLASGGALAIGALATAFTGLGFAVVSGIRNLDEYDINLKRVQATIEATGGGLGLTANQLQEEAERLAIATLTSVEAVQRAQAELITFNRVLGDESLRAISLAQDLAEAGFGTIESNAVLLGKALQDPITGISALTRVGVTLTQQQKDLAKAATDTGDVFAAQGIILDAVAGQVEGVGEAVASGTLAGDLDSTGIAIDRFTRAFAESSNALTVWQRVVKGAGIAANSLAEILEGPTSDELFSRSLDSSLALADAQNKLFEITDRTSNAYARQAAIVSRLRQENIEAIALASEAAEQDNKRVEAQAEAARRESEARAKIQEELKAEADERAATEKQKDDERLERQKNSALAQLEVLTALNDSELEAIDRKEQQRLEKIKSFRDQELILDSEFQLAKTEIELAAENERQTLKDEIAQKDRERAEESSKLFTESAQTLTNGLIDAAQAGDSLKDSLLSSVQSIAQGIIQAGIEQLIQQQVISRITGALFTAEKTAEVSATVAQAGLNAFASTAAIPVVGPAAAPAAASAAITAASALGSGVISASTAREQGGQLSAGQSSTVAERGQLEILTPSSSSRIRTAQQMRQIMGDNSSATVNFTVIDQSTGEKEYQQERNDDGSMTLLIRNVVAGDAANANSQIRKSFDRNTNLRSAR